MPGKVPQHVVGERVRLALEQATPHRLSKGQLVQVTGLSVYQVTRGLIFLKETGALEHGTPLTWLPRRGYGLGGHRDEWVRYEQREWTRGLTSMLRLVSGTLAPHAQARPDDLWAVTALTQMNALTATLDALANTPAPPLTT